MNKDAQDTMTVDKLGLGAAPARLNDDAITPAYNPHREAIVKLLNDSLATELVDVLRYKRDYFMATGLLFPAVADEFLVHASAESSRTDRLAKHTVQLGGEPDFSPVTLLVPNHADHDESNDLKTMIRANLIAERIAVETYRQMIELVGEKDSANRSMLEHILAQKEEHVDEFSEWLEKQIQRCLRGGQQADGRGAAGGPESKTLH